MTVEHHVAQSLTVPMFAYRDAGGSGEQAAEAGGDLQLRL